MDPEFIRKCQQSSKPSLQFVFNLHCLYRAVQTLLNYFEETQTTSSDLVELSDSNEPVSPLEESSQLSSTIPEDVKRELSITYFKKCSQRFNELELEYDRYEFGRDLCKNIEALLESIADLLLFLGERITGDQDPQGEERSQYLNDGDFGSNFNSTFGYSNGNEANYRFQNVVKGLVTGQQTRFKFYSHSSATKESIAGIRDMAMGRMRTNGMRRGLETIRFDRGHGKTPHININPRGIPRSKDPHISVPASVVEAAPYVQKGVQYAGMALIVASVVIEGYRMFKAVRKDYLKSGEQEQIYVAQLEAEIVIIREYLSQEDSTIDSAVRLSLEQAAQEYSECIQIVTLPTNSLQTGSSIFGGFGGGTLGGIMGSAAGTWLGTAIATVCLGPVGLVVAPVAGAIVGGLSGGVGGGIVGSKAGEKVVDVGLDIYAKNKTSTEEKER